MSASPGEQAKQDRLEEFHACPSGGFLDPALSESGTMAASPGRDCLGTAEELLERDQLTNPRISIVRDSTNGSVTVVGNGFSVNSDIEVDFRIRSQGVVGSPYFVTAATNSTGSFTTQVVDLSCPEPDPVLYVVGEDETGNVDVEQIDITNLGCD